MERNLFIHAGPGKTGTTFLQSSLFGRIESAQCLVKPDVEVGKKKIRFADLFDFSPEVWDQVNLDHSLNNEKSKNITISDERIFGGVGVPQSWIPSPPPGSEISPSPRRHMHARPFPCNVSQHLQSIRELTSAWGIGGRVKFLLTPRRQDTRLASGYSQVSNRIRGAGQANFRRWVHRLTHGVVGYYKGGGKKLDYSSWWKQIAAVVGEENMLFLPFELLQENAYQFLRRWLEFVGEEEADSIARSLSGAERRNCRSEDERWSVRSPVRRGPGIPRWISTKLFRIAERLGLPTLHFSPRFPLRRPDFQRDSEIHLTDELSGEILSVYEKGNRRLDELISNLELEKFGYY